MSQFILYQNWFHFNFKASLIRRVYTLEIILDKILLYIFNQGVLLY